MNPRWYIYVLKDAAGAARYVGATLDLPRRLRQHERARPWFVEFAVLETTSDSWEARDLERAWIRRLSAAGCQLDNTRLNPVKNLTVRVRPRRGSTSRRDLPARVVARRHGAATRQPASHVASPSTRSLPTSDK